MALDDALRVTQNRRCDVYQPPSGLPREVNRVHKIIEVNVLS